MSKAKEHGIEKLSDYAHIRKRTEMYLSSRSPHTQDIIIYEDGKPILKEMEWVPALYTAFREALDNAVDEIVGHNQGNRIDIEYDEEKTVISVQDNGRGIPIDYDDQHKDYIASMVVSNARAGRNFGERGEVAGTNGIGISAVCMVSEWFELEIHRDNKKYTQRFLENPLPGGQNLKRNKPKIIDLKSDKTGTKITFKLSSQVFDYMTLPTEFVRSRVYEIAVSNPLIRIYFNGERIKVSPYVEKSLWPTSKPIIVDIKEDNIKAKFYIVPNFSGNGEVSHSLVNNVPAFDGGVHMDTFRRYFYSGLISALERESKRRKVAPNKTDISDGLLIYNITHMTAPDFNSQSKTRLINEWVGKSVKKSLDDEELYKGIIKKNKEWIEEIFERAAHRTNKKEESEINKAAKQAKRSKVKDLQDATGKDRTKCVLFLMEGDCLHEHTEVTTINKGELSKTRLSDINEGDVLVSRHHRLVPVTNIIKKISKCVDVKTTSGKTISASKEHRLFVFDVKNQCFYYEKVGNIDVSNHKLVSSDIVNIYDFVSIRFIEHTNDDVFTLKIHYDKEFILSSDNHMFAVFDCNTYRFCTKKAKDLTLDDILLLKKQKGT